ncbi:hypothetical protein HKX48_007202 [Thoreauomyces humboldtii]|nr:hypothetical protein HKX48_007202 [Thoreauomyces humboldtii]
MSYVPPHRRGAANAAPAQLPTSTIPSATPAHTGILPNKATPRTIDFFHAHLQARSPLLKTLEARKQEFEQDPNVERMFVSNRATSTPETTVTPLFANQFANAMEEVDDQSGRKLRDVKRFLDLGSSPGGFSKWVLEHNPEAKGLGVTLPPEMDGLPMILAPPGPRYDFIYKDVTERPTETWYQDPEQGTYSKEELASAVVPGPRCDLVIAGCIYRDNQTANADRSGPPPIRARARQLLSFSQLLVALRNLQDDGTLVIVSNMKPHLHNLEILCFLKELFHTLIPVKPKQVHTIRSSYYLVALGFDASKGATSGALDRLESILGRIAASESDKGVEGILLLEDDEAKVLERYGDFIMDFFQPLWESQMIAIDRKLAGLRSQGGNRRGHGGGGYQQQTNPRPQRPGDPEGS